MIAEQKKIVNEFFSGVHSFSAEIEVFTAAEAAVKEFYALLVPGNRGRELIVYPDGSVYCNDGHAYPTLAEAWLTVPVSDYGNYRNSVARWRRDAPTYVIAALKTVPFLS